MKQDGVTMQTSPVTVTSILANAVVIGRPVWTPAVLAALATMFFTQRTPEAPVQTPPQCEAADVD